MSVVARFKRSRLLADLVRRTSPAYGRLRETFARLVAAPLAEREAFTQERLARILATASRTEYGLRFDEGSLARWPLLSSAMIRGEEFRYVRGTGAVRIPARTSGTTGTPLELRRSWSSVVAEQAMLDGVLAEAGVDARHDRIAVLRGDPVPGSWRLDEGGRRLVLSANRLDLATVAAMVEKLRAFAPRCLWAFPSSLHALCGLMRLRDLHLAIPVALTSSEVLSEDTVRLAETTLSCRVIDYYGQAERVAFASSVDGRMASKSLRPPIDGNA